MPPPLPQPDPINAPTSADPLNCRPEERTKSQGAAINERKYEHHRLHRAAETAALSATVQRPASLSLVAAVGAALPPLLSSSSDLPLLYIYLENISLHGTLGFEVPL